MRIDAFVEPNRPILTVTAVGGPTQLSIMGLNIVNHIRLFQLNQLLTVYVMNGKKGIILINYPLLSGIN